ncbi:MAG: DUF2490 domain-containing protein [Acetobacteraceae bacterium]|nr:DUF2490 domain-containing protein [Acetobacteraceae bacterium]
MRRVLPISCAAISLALGGPALASEDSQAWETLNVSVALPSHFKLSNETVVRSGKARGFYELEDNLMLGYQADPHVTVWLGYTHDPQYLHGHFTIMERRFRQQVSLDNMVKLGAASLGGRLRFEERWREGLAGTAWRFRPAVNATMPLVVKTKLVLNHESFINFNTTAFQKQSGYERMRNWASVVVPVSKRVSLDGGYLNQHGFVRGGPDTSDNVLNLGLTASF